MKQTQRSHNTQRGYTIVELSVAVAIAGVLLVGSIALVQTVLNTSRANDTISGLARVTAQIDKIWSNQPNYASLSIASAGGAGVFEGLPVVRDATNAVTGVTSKFNRPITLSLNPNLPSGTSNRGYAMTYTGIPTNVCADIVSAAGSSGVRGIAVIPEDVAGTTTGGAPVALTLSAADALTGVDAAGVVVADPSTNGLNLVNMTGVKGCGTAKNTVSIVFANWK
jgi:prepilin-type N-terminal cleavage/methylation domain-containing protein